MKTALIYVRVSTLTQKADHTIDRQITACQEYCEAQGLNIFDVYKDDGISGSDKDRAFQLIDYVTEHAKNIDLVLFENVDRFSRDIFLCGYLQTSLARLNVDMVSITQDGIFDDSDPYKKMVNVIMKAIANFEKDMTVHKLKRGKAARIAKGKRSNGNCPFGYDYAQEEIGGTRKKVVIIENEAAIVKQIFRTFLDTRSTTRTARAINTMGYVNKRGNAFTKQSIQTILKNDFYTGVITYNGEKHKGDHTPIVSKHLFTKAQNLFRS